MSDGLIAVLLGLVEGLTEFIPVSSTGHLLLTKTLLGLPNGYWDTFIVLIQLGAILAVVAVYFQRLWDVVLRLPTDPSARKFALSVMVSVAPAFLAGALLHKIIKTVLFESPALICISLIVGGIILLLADRNRPAVKETDAMRLTLRTSLIIGLFQCLSLMPGVSRSGSTLVGSLLLGVDRRAAAEFSFFMAIPIMVGAFALDLYSAYDSLDLSHIGTLAIGFVTAFVSGLIAVRFMLDYVSRQGFGLFAWWRIIVGGGGLLTLALVR